jgi:hypothetical protein
MRAFLQDDWRERWSFLSMLHCGLEITDPALASAAFAAGGGVRAEGMAEEAAAQPLVPHALWEAIAGLAATLIR